MSLIKSDKRYHIPRNHYTLEEGYQAYPLKQVETDSENKFWRMETIPTKFQVVPFKEYFIIKESMTLDELKDHMRLGQTYDKVNKFIKSHSQHNIVKYRSVRWNLVLKADDKTLAPVTVIAHFEHVENASYRESKLISYEIWAGVEKAEPTE